MSFVFVLYFVVKGPSTIGKSTDNCVCVCWVAGGGGVCKHHGKESVDPCGARRKSVHHDSVPGFGSNF